MKGLGMKVIAARICHESHSFSVLPTTLTEFANMELLWGDEIIRQRKGTRSEMGGFISAAEELGWDLTPVVSANAAPSGPVTAASYEAMVEPILRSIRAAKGLRAVVLSLHGSMYVEGLPDPEGDLLARIRREIGHGIVLAATLDLHANVTAQMAAHCSLMTSYRTTPHVDQFETGQRLCALVQRALNGEIDPAIHVARRAMITGMDLGRTLGDGPMVRLLQEARRLERSVPGILDISVNAGFSFGDVYEAGPSVVVIGDGPSEACQQAAERLMDMAEQSRDVSTVRLISVEDAIAKARRPASAPGPLILADYTDGPGGGGYGDATKLLAALLEAQIPGTVVGALYDPESAQQAIAAGLGRECSLRIGGKTDPRFGGPPVPITGMVSAVSDGCYVRKGPFETGTRASLGPSAVITVGSVQVIVASYRVQAEDREQYRIFGIDPDHANILALKGINHFRADFESHAREIAYVEAGGIHATDLTTLPYTLVRRPIWPLDDDATTRTERSTSPSQ